MGIPFRTIPPQPQLINDCFPPASTSSTPYFNKGLLSHSIYNFTKSAAPATTNTVYWVQDGDGGVSICDSRLSIRQRTGGSYTRFRHRCASTRWCPIVEA